MFENVCKRLVYEDFRTEIRTVNEPRAIDCNDELRSRALMPRVVADLLRQNN